MPRVAIRRSRLRAAIAERDGLKCWLCGRVLWLGKGLPFGQKGPTGSGQPTGFATLDHIRPRAHGGKTEMANLKLACEPCNKKRGHHGSYPIADLA
jgi:5-methylcytosine-specific restriction endonuclease McrA